MVLDFIQQHSRHWHVPQSKERDHRVLQFPAALHGTQLKLLWPVSWFREQHDSAAAGMGEVSDEVYRLGVIFAHTIYSNQTIPEDWKLRCLIGGTYVFILIYIYIYMLQALSVVDWMQCPRPACQAGSWRCFTFACINLHCSVWTSLLQYVYLSRNSSHRNFVLAVHLVRKIRNWRYSEWRACPGTCSCDHWSTSFWVLHVNFLNW